MPINPYRDERRAREFIDKILTKELKTIKTVRYSTLVKETLLRFQVSRSFVEKWILDFYVKDNLVKLEDGDIVVVS